MLVKLVTVLVAATLVPIIDSCAAGIIVGHPFDTVKVRLQMQGISGIETRYRGMLHCFLDIVKTESFAGLYKGVVSPIISAGGINAVVFGVHGQVMYWLQGGKARPQMLNTFIGGAMGGLAASPLTSTAELIKLRMQMQGIGEREYFIEYSGHESSPTAHKYYRSSWDCCKKIYKNEGIRGLCRGIIPTIGRETPSFGAYFLTFDFCCRQSADFYNIDISEVGPLTLLIGGGLAGQACWLISFPFDVVKSRLQGDSVTGVEYKGMVDCIRKTYYRDGIRGFYKGLLPTLVRAFPVNAATFATVVTITRLINKQRSN